MALVDYSNNVIYWDGVNWKWLPHVKVEKYGNCFFIKDRTASPIKCREDAIRLLKSINFHLSPIQMLGISEISHNLFLYEGKLYKVSNRRPSIVSLISNISGKSTSWVTKKVKGKGLLSKTLIDELVQQELMVEYNGKFYSGYLSIAKDVGINYSVMYRSLADGITIDEIIKKYKPRRIKDHQGNYFDTTKDMLEYWGIPRRVYNKRLSKGLSLEEALTLPPANIRGTRKCKDHLGNEYASKGDMVKAYGVKYHTFAKRLCLGWSLEEALTGKRREK